MPQKQDLTPTTPANDRLSDDDEALLLWVSIGNVMKKALGMGSGR